MSVYNGLIKVTGRGTISAGQVPESFRSIVNRAIENFPNEQWSPELRDLSSGIGALTEQELAEYFDKEYTMDGWIHSVMFIDAMEELARTFEYETEEIIIYLAKEYGNVETFSLKCGGVLTIGIQDPELSVPESDRILDETESDRFKYDSLGEELLRRLPESGWEYYTPEEFRDTATGPRPHEA